MSTENKHSGATASGNLTPHFSMSKRTSKSKTSSLIGTSITVSQVANADLAMSVATDNPAADGGDGVIAIEIPGVTISCVDTIAGNRVVDSGSKTEFNRIDASHSRLLAGPHLDLEPIVESTTGVQEASTMLVPIADDDFRPNIIVPAAEYFHDIDVAGSTTNKIFQPKWNVDQFVWPAVTTDLIYQFHELFDTATDLLLQSILTGRKRLAITGIVRGEGRTTISIVLARKLTNDGKRVLLVDADLVNPQMAPAIGLSSEISWLTDEAISKADSGAVSELVIGNRVNNACLMPLAMPNRMSYNQHAFEVLNECLNQLEAFFDLIILDMGPVSQLDAGTLRSIRLAQGGMLIHDPQLSNVHNFTRAFEKFITLQFEAFALLQNSARGDFGQVA